MVYKPSTHRDVSQADPCPCPHSGACELSNVHGHLGPWEANHQTKIFTICYLKGCCQGSSPRAVIHGRNFVSSLVVCLSELSWPWVLRQMVLELLKGQQYLGTEVSPFPAFLPMLLGLGLFIKMILEGASWVICTQCPGSSCLEQGLERDTEQQQGVDLLKVRVSTGCTSWTEGPNRLVACRPSGFSLWGGGVCISLTGVHLSLTVASHWLFFFVCILLGGQGRSKGGL